MKKLLLILLLASCAAETRIQPPGLIPRDAFVNLLVDIQQLEAVSKQKMIRIDNPAPRIAGYYVSVFHQHNITEQQFRDSFLWYYEDPDDMIAIYEEVLNILVQQQTERGRSQN